MEYSSDFTENEQEKSKNGQREHVSWDDVQNWLGSDQYVDKSIELLMDILNKQYAINDVLKDIRDYSEFERTVKLRGRRVT